MTPHLLLALLGSASLGAQTFTDRWTSSGFDRHEGSQGVALGDYDGDGDVDIFLPSIFFKNPIPWLPDLGGPDACYENDGWARFRNRAAALGLADAGQARGAAWGDYDNDGRLDLYLVRGLQQALAQSHKLYRNLGGSFDASPSSWVSAAKAGRSVCWADYDNDGYLDVFVTNGLDSPVLLPDARSFLFRNNRDGSFTDVTVAVGLEDRRNAYGCAWGDYDNDGDMDLFVATKGFEDPVLGLSDPQPNALFRNQRVETGTASFVDVAAAAGVTGIDALDAGSSSLGAAWGDFDNDGWLDLYVTNGFSGAVPYPTPNRLYRNHRDGTFEDRSLIQFVLGLSTESSFGSTWGDFNNDGYLDLYVSNGNVPIVAETRNNLFVSSGPPLYLFRNEAAGAGVDVQAFAQACASADLDGDGWLDIYSTNGALMFEVADNLFINNGGTNHWLHLTLEGVISNRSAVGARVTLRIGTRSQTREVAAGSGFQSMDDLRVEFGLGTATRANQVTIRWPSGCVQTLTDVAADQVLRVVEPCQDSILRAELRSPRGSMFPLPSYAAAPGLTAWKDPEPVLTDRRSLFYQHTGPVALHLVRSGNTVEASW